MSFNINIATFEDHSEVLSFWVELSVADSTLIFIDRHFDLKKINKIKLNKLEKRFSDGLLFKDLRKDQFNTIDKKKCFGCDDFLDAAIHLNMFKRIIWVTPSYAPRAANNFDDIFKELISFIPAYGNEMLENFYSNKYMAGTTYGGCKIEITNIEFLEHLNLTGKILFDVDLDYFSYEVPRKISKQMIEVRNAFRKYRDFICYPVTITYSIATGHLPTEFRWLGEELCTYLDLAFIPSIPDKNQSEYIYQFSLLAKLAKKRQNNFQGINKLKIEFLALYYLQIDEFEKARDIYSDIKKGSPIYNILSYKIGLWYFSNKDYKNAIVWLHRVIPKDICDTLSSHSMCVLAVCLFKLKKFDRCSEIARKCAEILPMRKEGMYLLEACGRELNDQL